LSEQKPDLQFCRGDLVKVHIDVVGAEQIALIADDTPETHPFADVLCKGRKTFVHVSRIEKLS